jgi:hypothetical protein
MRFRQPGGQIAGETKRRPAVNPLNLRRGDVLRLRKPHPCGSTDFEVVRLGADIGLHCVTCGRRIMLARSLLERRMERFVSRAPEYETPSDLDFDLGGPEPPRPSQ